MERIHQLTEKYEGLVGEELLRPFLLDEFPGRIALASSFGIESAALLAIAATIDKAVPVLFTNTGVLFPQTEDYMEDLTAMLGLSNVQTLRPSPDAVATLDSDSSLWQKDKPACCNLRKVVPLRTALTGHYDAWITGRKRYQGGDRATLPSIEEFDGLIKVNPLAGTTPDEINAIFKRYSLPRHPLQAGGFQSVGCYPCTERTPPDATNPRAGRREGECGIHTVHLLT